MPPQDIGNLWLRLRWDPTFARPDTWILTAFGEGIRVRAIVGGQEYCTEFTTRWRTPEAEAPGAVFVRPLDDDSWLTEPMILDPALVPVQLHLRGAAKHANDILRCR